MRKQPPNPKKKHKPGLCVIISAAEENEKEAADDAEVERE